MRTGWLIAALVLAFAPCASGQDASLPAFQRALAESQAADWTFRLRGRVDADALAATQSRLNREYFGALPDVVGLRRARIGGEGEIGSVARWIAEIDLATGDVVPRDVFVGFKSANETDELRFGHFREPFSLEGGTSARFLAFMERSPINALDPARNWGIGWFRATRDENATFATGVFRSGVDSGDVQGGDGSDLALTSRVTWLPEYSDEGKRLTHLGLVASERFPVSGVVLINQQPRSPLLDPGDSSTTPFVETLRIPANYQQLVNAQWAMVRGSFWAQAEWYGSYIDQRGGGGVMLHGCHADCAYFLTGEHRSYLRDSGVFGPIRVLRPRWRSEATRDRPQGWGAWELTSRFAYLDFFDPDNPLGPQQTLSGERLAQATFGVNWYLTDQLRLMFNYSYVVPNDPNIGKTAACLYGMRLAVYW